MPISRRGFVPWQGSKTEHSELREAFSDAAMVQRLALSEAEGTKRIGITYFWSVTKSTP